MNPVKLEMEAGERFQTIRRELGVESFGINFLRLEPGQRGRIHRHERQEEVYLVLAGELTLVVDGEEHRIGPNELARIAPERRRQLANRGPESVRILALGGYGDHQSRDGIAWASWDEPDEAGRPPQEVPLPEDEPG